MRNPIFGGGAYHPCAEANVGLSQYRSIIVRMIHKARDLSPEEKNALERLVGRVISNEEEISIRVLQHPVTISAQRRCEIVDALKRYFVTVDAQRKPVSREDADRMIDEALRSTRPHYRSIN
jgi:hypothetical protein